MGDHFGEPTGMIVTPQAEKTSCFFETVVECRPCQLCSMFISPRSCVLLGENPHLRSGWGFLFDKMQQDVPVGGMETKWQVHWRARLMAGNRLFRKQKDGPRILCRGWRWIVAPSSEKAAQVHTDLFKSDVVEMVLPSSKAL